MELLFFFVILALSLWLLLFWWLNELELPSPDLQKFRKVLIVYPHPDDEVLTTGGLIQRLKQQGSEVHLVVLTKGEKGTPDAHLEQSLKQTRTNEMKRVAKILGIDQLKQEDFGDGELSHQVPRIARYLKQVMQQFQPDLIITYDRSGLYGHPDHIVVSEVVTVLYQRLCPQSTLWYASLPQSVLAMTQLPTHMAQDPEFIKRRKLPNRKIFIGWRFLTKLKALRAHQSQLQSFTSSLPLNFLPLEVYFSFQLFEYFWEEE